MQPVSVILGSHCHVPDGLAETEYETAYNERLKPFLSALYRYPRIPAVLHYSGPLLYWVERRRAEFFDLIREMLKRKQIEILSGGFYEPAMHLLTPQDRTGQVEMLSTYIRKHFGRRSAGAWISGSCWEQSVVTPLANCAIAYTFLPERFFAAAGVKSADLGQPVYTENQGSLITVFPVLPFGTAHYAAGNDTARNAGRDGAEQDGNGPSVTVGDLFALIGERGQNGVYTIFPERFSGNDAHGDICAFLEESLSPDREVDWTTPARFREELTGNGNQSMRKLYFSCGQEKNFLTECPEANTIYAKMVFTGDLVRQLRGDRERKHAALHEVYKAQCGNLYRSSSHYTITNPALRHAAYRALLSAERMTREAKKTVNALYSFDFDFDGVQEDIFRGNALSVYAHRKGGHIFGIDYLPVCWNYIDSFGRRSFVETLYPGDIAPAVKIGSGDTVRAVLDAIPPERVRRCGEEWWKETGSDRAKQRLTLSLPAPQGLSLGVLQGERATASPFGGVNAGGAAPYGEENPLVPPKGADTLSRHDEPITPPRQVAPPGLMARQTAFAHIGIEKTYRLMKDALVVSYTISNRRATEERLLFCPELHLAFAGNGEDRLRVFALKGDERAQVAASDYHSSSIDGYQFQDLSNETIIRFSSDKPFDALLGANTTAGRYQSTSVTVVVPLTLKAGAKVSREFRFTVTS
ncbi:MAG: DUF1925 domain-containing protein [Spirochaetaceae bacterium]|jgi:hypothetical protein|nr:DUF1925 domain-containing protein [Spirochaetaceae bacterium]